MPSQVSVTCYRSQGGAGNVPAINVKVQQLRFVKAHPSLEKELDAREDIAESVRQEAFEMAQEEWWRDAENLGQEVFGPEAKIQAEGRSGGWLTVTELGDPKFWTKSDITQWKRFEKKILSMLKPKQITNRYSSAIQNLLEENR